MITIPQALFAMLCSVLICLPALIWLAGQFAKIVDNYQAGVKPKRRFPIREHPIPKKPMEIRP